MPPNSVQTPSLSSSMSGFCPSFLSSNSLMKRETAFVALFGTFLASRSAARRLAQAPTSKKGLRDSGSRRGVSRTAQSPKVWDFFRQRNFERKRKRPSLEAVARSHHALTSVRSPHSFQAVSRWGKWECVKRDALEARIPSSQLVCSFWISSRVSSAVSCDMTLPTALPAPSVFPVRSANPPMLSAYSPIRVPSFLSFAFLAGNTARS